MQIISYAKSRTYIRGHPETITVVIPVDTNDQALPAIPIDDDDSFEHANLIWESLEYAGVVEAVPHALSVEEIPDHSMVVKWIIDSGCGHDLVSRQVLEGFMNLIFKANKPITFNTANGLAPSYDKASIGVRELAMIVKAWVMQSSPAVLSLGKRCMEEDYDFVWPRRGVPYFLSPDFKRPRP